MTVCACVGIGLCASVCLFVLEMDSKVEQLVEQRAAAYGIPVGPMEPEPTSYKL